jgi:ABC-2 type transport system permease protein
MNKLLTIAKNTFVETIRQPIFAIIIVTALFLLCLSPAITMYSLDDDNKFLREVGLSTLFLSSLFISIFAASGAVAEEIHHKTIVTVLSKPIARPVFILAKFLGVAAAVTLAHYICTIGFLMSIRHGALESVNDSLDWTVLASGAAVFIAAIAISAFCNYVYDWRFSSTAIVLTAIFSTIAIIFLSFIDKNWKFNPSDNHINMVDIYGSLLLLLAAMIVTAIAIALSTRFNIIVTLSACIGMFLLGLTSNYTFGRFAADHLWAKICYYLVPNYQIFWISDAIYEGTAVPLRYILITSSYTVCYVAAVLCLAVTAFQRRQVG